MIKNIVIDGNLALETVRVTEASAMAAAKFIGLGDEKSADLAAAKAMKRALDELPVQGTVRIGEGAESCVDDLFVGQSLGMGEGPKTDIALVALEGKSITARGGSNAMSVLAMAEDGNFLTVPDVYMDKIAIGAGLPKGLVDLDAEPGENLKALAAAKNAAIGDLVVCLLDRPRHGKLIAKVRQSGARINLIQDGDVSGVIATATPESAVDMYLGIGGAQQGVLAAAALRGDGGQMQGRLVVRNQNDQTLITQAGIEDVGKKYTESEMASGHVIFVATGVTHGPLLNGVKNLSGRIITHSMVMRSTTGTLRIIEGFHNTAHTNDG